jgi:alkanesulfonate monooxygenase SsuD/methylene tetrahydromethanopterin reductase-like flavin-dependent oxidoreductase (luciferase family)
VDGEAGDEPHELDAAHRGHRRVVPPAQAEQIERFRKAWIDAGHSREPRASVSRSIFPIVDAVDHAYSGRDARSQDKVGCLDGVTARFGKTYAAEPDQLVEQLATDEAIAAADTLLLTIPNQLRVDYCAHILNALLSDVAPSLGWR